MNREDIPWIAIIVLLLAAGFWIGQQFSSLGSEEQTADPPDAVQPSFRQRFWEDRSLDLAVQVGLIFVGALSIAALLPEHREDRPE